MKTYVFYHDDLDGRGAAWCLVRKIGPNHVYQPVNYSRPFPLQMVEEGSQVWILDYAPSVEEMNKLYELTEDITWIDHHISAMKRFEGLGTTPDLRLPVGSAR